MTVSKILIDLDVVTNALWKGSNELAARRFLSEVRGDENIQIFTPYSLLQRVLAWRNRRLAAKIFNFYSIYSDRILSWKEIKRNLKNIDYKAVVKLLEKCGVKREDSVLILIAGAFHLCIKTFNKKHLYNRTREINGVLGKFDLKGVEISVPA